MYDHPLDEEPLPDVQPGLNRPNYVSFRASFNGCSAINTYFCNQNSLDRLRVIKYHKTKIRQFSSHSFSIYAKFYHISETCESTREKPRYQNLQCQLCYLSCFSDNTRGVTSRRVPPCGHSECYMPFQHRTSICFSPLSLQLKLLLTHKELFQFTLIYIMRQVPNKELVTVWIANYSTIIRLVLLHVPSPYQEQKEEGRATKVRVLCGLQQTHKCAQAPGTHAQTLLYLQALQLLFTMDDGGGGILPSSYIVLIILSCSCCICNHAQKEFASYYNVG